MKHTKVRATLGTWTVLGTCTLNRFMVPTLFFLAAAASASAAVASFWASITAGMRWEGTPKFCTGKINKHSLDLHSNQNGVVRCILQFNNTSNQMGSTLGYRLSKLNEITRLFQGDIIQLNLSFTYRADEHFPYPWLPMP